MNLQNVLKDLTCPISLELFEEPISVPCCGKAFSRKYLQLHINSSNQAKCPLCNGDLSKFDVENAPKNVILSSLIQSLTGKIEVKEIVEVKKETKWKCSLEQMKDTDDRLLPVGELKLSLDYVGYTPKSCLFILVVDSSGSMSGRPWNQVQESLQHIILTNKNNVNVRTVVISYDSTAQQIDIPDTREEIINYIQRLKSGGGTNFLEAFKKVRDVLSQYTCEDSLLNTDNKVSGAAVTFLTDGDDQSGCKIDELPQKFKDLINSVWKGPISVHTVGFSKSHNFTFLNDLRKIGTQEGFYRYAEIDDEGDTLCAKLNAISDFVSSSLTVPVELEVPKCLPIFNEKKLKMNVQFPVNDHGYGTLCKWVKLDDMEKDQSVTVQIKNEKQEKVKIELIESKDITVFKKWLVKLVDEMALETLALSGKEITKYGKDAYDLHCSLLIQRGNMILKYIGSDEQSLILQNRLNIVLEQIKAIKRGETINKGKLTDLAYESHFKPIVVAPKKPKVYDAPTFVYKPVRKEPCMDKLVFTKGGDRKWTQCHLSIIFDKPDNIKKTIATSSKSDLESEDRDGNTPLIWAAFRGHTGAVKQLLTKGISLDLINKKNKHGNNALTMAINNNHWHTAEILFLNGARLPENQGEKLLDYAFEHQQFQMILFILKNGISKVTNEMKSLMNVKALEWLEKQNLDISEPTLDLAIQKGMYEKAEKLILNANLKDLPIQYLYDCIIPNSSAHLKIAELLLKVGVDVNGEGRKESPLFTAANKGSLEFVKLFLKFGAQVDKPNDKGNTPLWMACCNGFLDVAAELLNNKANPNAANLKGDTPLIPACQKGYEEIVLMLISSGGVISYSNTNGDTPVIICCRTGQAKILEILLTKTDKDKEMNHIAKIDGFNALLAATEQNKHECIKVLLKMGSKIEFKTEKGNPILSFATPLHLAAYYGKYEAAKVLLQEGANPNSKDINDSTPLHIAIKQNQFQIIELLKLFGADLKAKDKDGFAPSFYCKSIEMINELVDPTCSQLLKLSQRGFSSNEEKIALELLQTQYKIVKTFSNDHFIDVSFGNGITPLMEAIKSSNVEFVKEFLSLGADPKAVDSKGISCIAWAYWSNNSEILKLFESFKPSKEDNEFISNLKDALKNNIKDSLLLFPTQPPKYQIIDSESFISSSMKDHIECQTEIKLLDQESKKALNIIMERLGNSFNEPNILSHMMWRAKTFTVGCIMNGSKLPPSSIYSIYLFSVYKTLVKEVNSYLSNTEKKPKYEDQLLQYIDYLSQGLNSLPSFKGTIFRGTDILIDRTKFEKGSTFSWPTFTTGSLDWAFAGDFKNKKGTVFIIKCKNGKIIKEYSHFPQDNQVIILPNTQFKVTNWYQGDIIALGQENIRNTAFQLKYDDVEKLKKNNDPLIIEIEEL